MSYFLCICFSLFPFVAFVMYREWKSAPYGPWEHTPQDLALVTISINDLDEPLTGSSSSSSSNSSSSSALRTTSGPKAGTNLKKKKKSMTHVMSFDNPDWLHAKTMAQSCKTRSNASILLPHMQ